MSKKLPAFQMYPGDWRKDPSVQALDYEYRGIWFEMLLLMHESDQRGKLLLNGKAMPDEALARLLGLDFQKLKKVKTTLLDYGVASTCKETGALMNRRMVRDEEIREKRRKAGKKGGNPDLLKQKPSKDKKKDNQIGNQKTTPSSSTSVSSSNNIDYVSFVDWWNECNGCSLRITEKKRANIRARLRTFSKDEIFTSIKNRSQDDWINGDGKKYKTKWESFFVNDEKVERYLHNQNDNSVIDGGTW